VIDVVVDVDFVVFLVGYFWLDVEGFVVMVIFDCFEAHYSPQKSHQHHKSSTNNAQ